MDLSKQSAPRVLRLIIPALAFALVVASTSGCIRRGQNYDEANLLTILLVAYAANPCLRTAMPIATAGRATGTSLVGAGSIIGKVRTTTGAPVLNALLLIDDNTSNDASFFSTHTSLAADGSFEVAGIRWSTGPFKVSVEPLNPAYAGRIDTHIDCFASPRSFTAGWYQGDGATAATSAGSATAVPAGGANQRVQIGTIVVSP